MPHLSLSMTIPYSYAFILRGTRRSAKIEFNRIPVLILCYIYLHGPSQEVCLL